MWVVYELSVFFCFARNRANLARRSAPGIPSANFSSLAYARAVLSFPPCRSHRQWPSCVFETLGSNTRQSRLPQVTPWVRLEAARAPEARREELLPFERRDISSVFLTCCAEAIPPLSLYNSTPERACQAKNYRETALSRFVISATMSIASSLSRSKDPR